MDNLEEHRRKVGGLWEEIGSFQLQLLKSYGLKSEDYLLDIGCGSLRGGVKFIDFLKDNHYYGVEKESWLLKKGIEKELPKYGLDEEIAHFLNFSDFQFSQQIDQKFDFLLAQSVFTHIEPKDIEICMKESEKVLKQKGNFLATFWPGQLKCTGSYLDRSHEHEECTYPINWFREKSKIYNLEFSYEGGIGHPRDQHLLVLKK